MHFVVHKYEITNHVRINDASSVSYSAFRKHFVLTF